MDYNRPFDLNKLDFKGIRLKKRKKMLLYSLPLLLIFVCISFKLISLSVFSTMAKASSKSGDYAGAVKALQPLTVANVVEPYVVHYNMANALYRQGQYDQAEDKYRQALGVVDSDHECLVRLNLTLTLEKKADNKVAEKKYDEAVILYDQARAIIADGKAPCGPPGNSKSALSDEDKLQKPQVSQEMQNAENRIAQKSSQAKRARNGDGAKDQGEESKPDASQPTEGQLEQLQLQQQAALKAHNNAQNYRSNGTDYGSLDSDVNKW